MATKPPSLRISNPTPMDALSHTRRAYHIELGALEKALLAEDPALKRFKSHKKSVNSVKRMGDVLTLVVVVGSVPAVSSFSMI
ncbi:hypothetical protein ACB094_04G129300 [Castanea mollissima]